MLEDRVDNFTLSVATVPEPASLALFGLGVAGLLVWRRGVLETVRQREVLALSAVA